jgi:long-subunit fatty acid transport protein
MNRVLNRLSALAIVLLAGAATANAQLSDISPYSRYGIGDLQDQNSVLNASMGGTGIAYHNDFMTPYVINLKNPASYAYGFVPVQDSSGTGGLRMTTAEAGIVDNILSLSSGGQTARSNNAYLSYVALNIPINRHFGLGMGLSPVSSEGYTINTSGKAVVTGGSQPDSTLISNEYSGAGGINKVFVGLAYAPIKNLSIGGNASYLFGNITNEENIFFAPNAQSLNSLKAENTSIHAFAADFGIMYTVTLKKDSVHPEKNWYLSLGATVAPSINVNAGYSLFAATEYISGTSNYIIDTVKDSSSTGRIKLPLMYGVGITLKRGDKWTFSFDRTTQEWSQYRYFGQAENLTDSYQYGFGVLFIPNKDNPKNYFQRLQYRFGLSYGQSNLDLENTPIINKYVSFGIGVPVGNIRRPFDHPAMVNLGLQVGMLGTTSNNLIQQNYVKLYASFTFDDHWFDKRKFQ